MSFKFVEPSTLDEAVNTLSEYGYDAKLIAGGTAVVLMLQQKLIAPTVLVSLARLPNLNTLCDDEAGLHVGPMVNLYDLSREPAVIDRFPALAYACEVVANVRVRHQATLAGNLAEADYASDPPSVLLALEARITARGPNGEREIPISAFFTGFYSTVLEPDEVITGIFVPALPTGTRMTYHKFTTRSSEDRPCVGVAAILRQQDGICRDVRVAVGAATETAQRLPEAEAQARDRPVSLELIEDIAGAYAATLEPLDDLRGSASYRSKMIQVHVRRALMEVSDVRG